MAAEVQLARILLVLAVFALLLLGLVMVYSASSASLAGAGEQAWADVKSQAIYAVAGVAAALVLWVLPYHVWDGWLTWAAWGVSLVLLALTALVGNSDYGATRWLTLGPVNLQPSEFAKVAFLLMSAQVVGRMRSGAMERRAQFWQILLLILAPLLFLYKTQSDLGTTIICAVGILAVAWLGGVPLRWMLGICAAGVAFAFFAIVLTGYRSDRMVFLDPWNDGEDGYGTGYNIIRSYYAIAEGGLFGVGLGQGREKFDYLFASDSDFIYSIVCEELGMVGALAVVILFLVILFAGLRIAHNAPDEYGAMLAGGLTVMLVFQAFLNMGCAIGVLPTTGKPLPFISSGGTSLVVSCGMVGLILSVSRAAGAPSIYEQRRADLRVVRAREARPRPQKSQRQRSGTLRASGAEGSRSFDYALVRGGSSERVRSHAGARSGERARSSVQASSGRGARSSGWARSGGNARTAGAAGVRSGGSARSSSGLRR